MRPSAGAACVRRPRITAGLDDEEPPLFVEGKCDGSDDERLCGDEFDAQTRLDPERAQRLDGRQGRHPLGRQGAGTNRPQAQHSDDSTTQNTPAATNSMTFVHFDSI